MPVSQNKNLGVLRPVGGGDPIPLLQDELTIGRRHSCDISLDFENISGRHCTLKYFNGLWHVRDLRSTNGTFVNRQRIENDHGVLPDDELKIATHLFTIDYEPAGHHGIASTNQALEEGMAEASRSLLELAGIHVDPDERRAARPHHHRHATPQRSLPASDEHRALDPPSRSRPRPEPEADSSSGEHLASPPSAPLPNDDEFFDMIQGDLK
jgi:adenylate cyclase